MLLFYHDNVLMNNDLLQLKFHQNQIKVHKLHLHRHIYFLHLFSNTKIIHTIIYYIIIQSISKLMLKIFITACYFTLSTLMVPSGSISIGDCFIHSVYTCAPIPIITISATRT